LNNKRVTLSTYTEQTAYGTGEFTISGVFVASPALLNFKVEGKAASNSAGDKIGITFVNNALKAVGFTLGSPTDYMKPGTMEKYKRYRGVELSTKSAANSAQTGDPLEYQGNLICAKSVREPDSTQCLTRTNKYIKITAKEVGITPDFARLTLSYDNDEIQTTIYPGNTEELLLKGKKFKIKLVSVENAYCDIARILVWD
jgi:predicted transcriptional regulator